MVERIFVTVLAASLCVSATGCIAVVKGDSAESKPKPVAAAPMDGKGMVEPITALDRKPQFEREAVSAEVRYVNDTGRTFNIVTIWCRALDKGGYEVESEHVNLGSAGVGPIGPGFKAKRFVTFVQASGVVSAVACEVTEAK